MAPEREPPRSDEEIAALFRGAVNRLNDAITSARAAGLVVQVHVTAGYDEGVGAERPVVHAQLLRRIQAGGR